MDFATPYLTEQIIAYIGNKRKLLSLIYRAMENTGIEIKPGLKFFDVFSGSGVVSRLAKSLKFEVFTNDWEYYSYILSSCYLTCNNKDITTLFGGEEKLEKLLEEINNLPSPKEEDCYIAKYYGPKEDDINAVDYKTERLFYTRENALTIDKIRNYIEETYPLSNTSEENLKKRNILLANLIYECATHTNTSGVFKAYHKGFGGYSKDALKRILGQIALHLPVLIDSDYPVHVYQKNANELVRQLKGVDIAYLDPPYNQHQYGSNYHMLNTIAKWDKIPALLTLNDKGVLKEKAAIRHDWVNTRSEYCYTQTAVDNFRDLIENLDAKYILISYSTDGIIPFEDLKEICMKKGKVGVVTNEYTTYRGGKQSNKRKNTNIEFILTIDTTKESTEETVKQLDTIFLKKKFLLLFKEHFSYKALKEKASNIDGDIFTFTLNNNDSFKVKTNYCFTITPLEDVTTYSLEKINSIISLLTPMTCKTKEEELSEIFNRIVNNEDVTSRLWRLIPQTLKKLAHKKNQEVFTLWLNNTKKLEEQHKEEYSVIKDKLNAVEEIANKRFIS